VKRAAPGPHYGCVPRTSDPTTRVPDALEAPLRRYLLTGDEASLEAVVLGTRPRLLAAARRIGAPQDAEDAVQSAYLSLVRKRGAPLEAPVFAWLLTAVVRVAYRRKALERREYRIAEALAVPVDGRTPLDAAVDAEEAALLRGDVARLPDRYRDPVVLHYLHGLDAAETGRLLGIPGATVRTRLHRARALIKFRWSPRVAHGFLVVPWLLADAGKAAAPWTAAAATGGAMKAAATAAVVVVAVAAGVVVGTRFTGGADAPGGGAAEEDTGLRAAVDRLTAERDALRKESAEAAGRTDRAAADLEAVRTELAAARAAAEAAAAPPATVPAPAADAASAPASAAPADPKAARFAFPEYADTFREVDWKSVGSNLHAMVPLLRDLSDAVAEGRQPSPEDIGKIQQHNGALVTAALKLMNKVPGSGVNGSFTHPAFQVNSIAAALDAAGLPLTDPQAQALESVGRDFTDKDRARLAAYDERAWEMQKVLDEAELKDRFYESAFAVLTAEQRDALSPPATRGLVSFDLFCSGLMLAQFLSPVPAKDREALIAGLEPKVASRLSVPAERRAELHALVADWVASLPDEWFSEEPRTVFGQPLIAAAYVEEVGRRELVFLRSAVSTLALPEAAVEKARKAASILLPLVQKAE